MAHSTDRREFSGKAEGAATLVGVHLGTRRASVALASTVGRGVLQGRALLASSVSRGEETGSALHAESAAGVGLLTTTARVTAGSTLHGRDSVGATALAEAGVIRVLARLAEIAAGLGRVDLASGAAGGALAGTSVGRVGSGGALLALAIISGEEADSTLHANIVGSISLHAASTGVTLGGTSRSSDRAGRAVLATTVAVRVLSRLAENARLAVGSSASARSAR